MLYTAIWLNPNSKGVFNEEKFKEEIPLELLGRSLGGTMMNLVVLEGYDLLSEEYKATLSRYFDVIDYTECYRKIVDRYPDINKFYSPFERNCFLRWIAFKELSEGEGQFFHFDSDIVLNVPAREVMDDCDGLTFVLQNCPAFVSVADSRWFDAYEEHLNWLEEDIVGYSESADEDREPHNTYRNPIGSDQDLMQYLVEIGELPQDRIPSRRFHYMENLLTLKRWSVKRETDRLFGVHWQGTFCNLANIYRLINWLPLPNWLIKKVVYYDFYGSKVAWSFGARVIHKIGLIFGLNLPRTRLIEEYQMRPRLMQNLLEYLKI